MTQLRRTQISQEAWYHFFTSPLTFLVTAPDSLSIASMLPFYATNVLVVTIATSLRYLVTVPFLPLAAALAAKTWLLIPVAGVTIMLLFSVVVFATARSLNAALGQPTMVGRLSMVWMASSPILLAGGLLSEFFIDPTWPIALTLITTILATVPGLSRALHVPWPKAVILTIPLISATAITALIFTTWPIVYLFAPT